MKKTIPLFKQLNFIVTNSGISHAVTPPLSDLEVFHHSANDFAGAVWSGKKNYAIDCNVPPRASKLEIPMPTFFLNMIELFKTMELEHIWPLQLTQSELSMVYNTLQSGGFVRIAVKAPGSEPIRDYIQVMDFYSKCAKNIRSEMRLPRAFHITFN